MATADLTPQPAHTSPPTSITPTRHATYQQNQNHLEQQYHHHHHQHSQPIPQHHIASHIPPHSNYHPHPSLAHHPMTDFTSPSQYVNHDAYGDSPTMTTWESATNSASSSLSIPYSATLPEHEFYPDFNEYLPADTASTVRAEDDSTRIEDDRTPVVTDHNPIPPRNFPAPPRGDGQETIRVKAEHQQQSLLSPFRPFPGQTAPLDQSHATMNLAPGSTSLPAQHYPTHLHAQPHYMAQGMPMHPGAVMYAQGPHGMVPVYPHQPHMVQYAHSSHMAGPMYTQSGHYYPVPPPHMVPQPHDFGPPRSRNGSPTSSISSSVASLTRSASTSSEMRQARPKVKLSYDDKRNIVELHRSNSSLRQEDIARQYGVDRSTISKIILSQHRWIQPQEAPVAPVPKIAKTLGGRFPEIEARLGQWWDEQIRLNLEVRDSVAREKAKEVARELGFGPDRFKASAKWLDKFKSGRKLTGKPGAGSGSNPYGYYTYNPGPYSDMSLMNSSIMLSRSQSAVTLSSSDSSGQDLYQPSPGHGSIMAPTLQVVTPHQMPLTRSETDLVHIDTTPSSRQRSQSSPQVLGEPGMQSPSSGKASRFVRPSPLNLQRQNSYHGSSPSPRRPIALVRSTTSQGGSLRRSRPTSLAASAFGITPIIGEEQHFAGSPINSPTTASTSGTHSRQHSDVSLAPFTTSLGGMTISPTISDSGEGMMAGVPPMTPITPGHGSTGGVFTNEYASVEGMDAPNEFGVQQSLAPASARSGGMYATMPNKHYAGQQYAVQSGHSNGYGQVPHTAHPATATAPGWR